MAWWAYDILGHPTSRQGCSLLFASPRDGLRPPLTRGGVLGLELANSRAARPRGRPCHLRAMRDGRYGSWRSCMVSQVADLRYSSIGEGRHKRYGRGRQFDFDVTSDKSGESYLMGLSAH